MNVAFATVLWQAISDSIGRIIFSYDIACKFGIHFTKCISQGKVVLVQLKDIPNDLIWLVPKFQLAGNKEACADVYSLNYTRWVGWMSGELVETIWAALNSYQYST